MNDWVTVTDPIPLALVDDVHISNGHEWFRAAVMDGAEWDAAALRNSRYRARFKNGWIEVTKPVPASVMSLFESEYRVTYRANGSADPLWDTCLLQAWNFNVFSYRVRLKTSVDKMPEKSAEVPDPRVAALEAENKALRWAIGKAGMELASYMGGFVLKADSTQHYISDREVPNFLTARAAIERKDTE